MICLGPATPLGAQVAWDGPMLVGTESPAGWGAYVVDLTSHGGIGLLVSWRGSGRTGYRIGFAEDSSDDLAVYGGADFSGPLLSAGEQFPLDVRWVGGGGAAIGDDFVLSFPLGISIGRSLETEGVAFRPYLTPRVALDAAFTRAQGSGSRADEVTLAFAFDLGLDVSPAPGWAVRFAVSGVDREAVAIGASFRND